MNCLWKYKLGDLERNFSANPSANAAETNHIELSTSMLNGRANFTQHDDETASVGNTGGAGSRVRGSTATQERDPDLPPLKVTVVSG